MRTAAVGRRGNAPIDDVAPPRRGIKGRASGAIRTPFIVAYVAKGVPSATRRRMARPGGERTDRLRTAASVVNDAADIQVSGKRKMWTSMMAFAVRASAPDRTTSSEMCQVGRAALQDLPAFNANRSYASYYASPDSVRKDLLDVCPELRRLVPKGYPFADDDARARAGSHVPVPGESNPPATEIFAIDPPRVSRDGKTAMVTMRYECSGLCGGYTEFIYLRTAAGWRQKTPRVIVVS